MKLPAHRAWLPGEEILFYCALSRLVRRDPEARLARFGKTGHFPVHGEREKILNESKRKVLILGSESIGIGDETLGFEILVNLLETLSKRDDGPAAIICWNTAVKLMVEGSPLLVHLKRLEEKGMNILAGRLCVSELELMNKIAVGKLATMDEILDLVLHHEVLAL